MERPGQRGEKRIEAESREKVKERGREREQRKDVERRDAMEVREETGEVRGIRGAGGKKYRGLGR